MANVIHTATDTDTDNFKPTYNKKGQDDGDDEDGDAKMSNSSSRSSAIAKSEDNCHNTTSSVGILYQETFTPWFVPLLFIAAPFFYKYGILIYKNKPELKGAEHIMGQHDHNGTRADYNPCTDDSYKEETKISFGYGLKGPTAGTGGLLSYWTSHTVSLENIDRDSITVGTASALDNLTTFGGWGIRFGRVEQGSISSKYTYTFTRAYNACNGPYCEFTEVVQDSAASSRSDDIDRKAAPLREGKRYRIVSNDAEKVASLLRSGSKVASP